MSDTNIHFKFESLISLQSDIVARHSNTRDLTEITLERDELRKQCESLAKHLEEAQLVVRNLKKKLTTTFQERATSPRDLEEFERTGRRRLRIRRYHLILLKNSLPDE